MIKMKRWGEIFRTGVLNMKKKKRLGLSENVQNYKRRGDMENLLLSTKGGQKLSKK